MMRETFLPDELRPTQPSAPRPSRIRALLVILFVVALLSSVPTWRLCRVEITGGDSLPASTLVSLQELVGSPFVLLNFDRIRRSVQIWPQVGSVDVDLELDGVLRIIVAPAIVRASAPIAHGWHGVAGDGTLSGHLEGPQYPILIDFPLVRSELRRALIVVDRISRASGAQVARIRRITPLDLEVQIIEDDQNPMLCVHVRPSGSRAEDLWCEARRKGIRLAAWSDLRRDDRMVLGGLS